MLARHLADDPARRADRPRRRVGFGQDHAGLPDGPLLRPDERRGAPRRHGHARVHSSSRCGPTVNVVFEESFLFSTTIRENIAFARPDASDAEIEAAARVAQAHDFILELPHGYDTVVGERGFTLSGGQRQRIALARAALADPAVLILDDATSAIDARPRRPIHASLGGQLGGRTTVLIAHRSSTLRLADRVIVARRGPHRRGRHERRAVARRRRSTASCSPGPTWPSSPELDDTDPASPRPRSDGRGRDPEAGPTTDAPVARRRARRSRSRLVS